MLHAGLDLSRSRLDVCLMDDAGEGVEHIVAPPDADGLRQLAERLRGQSRRRPPDAARLAVVPRRAHEGNVGACSRPAVRSAAPFPLGGERLVVNASPQHAKSFRRLSDPQWEYDGTRRAGAPDCIWPRRP